MLQGKFCAVGRWSSAVVVLTMLSLSATYAFRPQVVLSGTTHLLGSKIMLSRQPVFRRFSAGRSNPRAELRSHALVRMGGQERSLEGRVALVTGASSGMGFSTVIGLLKRGAHVVATCRDEASCRTTAEALAAACDAIEVAPGDVKKNSFSVLPLDLSSLKSVRSFAERFVGLYPQLDTLIANAGVMGGPFQRTADGFEANVQVNYLSQFLLVNLLEAPLAASEGPALTDASPRVILVSSLSSEKASLAAPKALVEAARRGAEEFDGMRAYRQSKLAQVLFARELGARRAGLLSCSVHPGVVDTNLFYKAVPPALKPLMKGLSALLVFLGKVKTAEQGAETALFLATQAAAEVERGQGLYWAECDVREPNPEIDDEALRQRHWAESAELVGLPDAAPSP